MTDFSKYKNVSLSRDTYTKLDSLRRVIVPNTTLSRAQTVNILVNEKVEKFNGNVPESFYELEKLPGVGHKTASVVMSQGFGHPTFPVDTHIHRLSQRWGLTNGRSVTQTEKDLKNIFPQKSWNKLHLQIIFYGREFCTAKGCNGLICEICKSCFPNRKTAVKTKK